MPVKDAKSPSIHAGHRQRMRQRLLEHGERVFHTHELLEMLLYHVLPYKNTNEIARNLINRFSTIDGVFSASKDELCEVFGVGEKIAEAIMAISEIDLCRLSENSHGAVLLCDYYEAGRYICEYMKNFSSSATVCALLNSKMELMSICKLYDLDTSSAGVRADGFIDAAVRANAPLVIMAHNHPHGPLFLSEADMATTSLVRSGLEKVGVTLVEHYIISGNEFLGGINHVKTMFSQGSAMWRFVVSKEVFGAKRP